MAFLVIIGVVVLVLLYCYCRRRADDGGTGENLQRSPRAVPQLLPEWTESDYQRAYLETQAKLANVLKIRCGDKVYIPFYTFHLKRMAYPIAATMEFINNWITFVLTIVLLFNNSLGIAIASFISLMAGQLIVHFTYGYNCYSNPASRLIAAVEDRFKEELSVSIANFETICRLFDYTYHGKSTPSNKETCTMSLSGAFFSLLNDFAVILVCIAIFVCIIMSYCGGTILAANEAASNPHAQNRYIAFIILLILLLLASAVLELAFVSAGTIGSIVGAIFWASLSIIGETAEIIPLILLANIMLYVVEEYYTALLFNKSPVEFGCSILFNIFYDVVSETEVLGSNLPNNVKAFVDVETTETSKKSPNTEKAKSSTTDSANSTDNTTTFDEENTSSADNTTRFDEENTNCADNTTRFDEENTNSTTVNEEGQK
jgi:hypothetical protein